MEQEHTFGPMVHAITASGTRVRSTATAQSNGKMAVTTSDNGDKPTCMVMASMSGVIRRSTKGSTLMIRSTVMESTSGRTAASTKASGKMANSTDLPSTKP